MTSETGFYHPDHGYWQTSNYPPPETREKYPKGTKEIPLKPGENYEWDDNAEQWLYVAPPEPEPQPRTVTKVYFRLALADMEKFPVVENAMAEADLNLQILWKDASSFRENDPELVQIADALNIDVKEVFDRAEAIKAARASLL